MGKSTERWFKPSIKTNYREYRNWKEGRKRISMQRLFSVEAKHLIIAWLVLTLAFSLKYAFFSLNLFPFMFLIYLLTAGLGFIFHELAHKYSAKRYGHWAEFRMSTYGLLMAIIFSLISGGNFIYAAPGATIIVPRSGFYGFGNLTRRENGIISISGPATNVLLSIVFLMISLLFGGLIGLIGRVGFGVNLWLASFNMIPFGGLDGKKVLEWNIIIWVIFTIPLWIITALMFFL
jgi:Zn-dependent protease